MVEGGGVLIGSSPCSLGVWALSPVVFTVVSRSGWQALEPWTPPHPNYNRPWDGYTTSPCCCCCCCWDFVVKDTPGLGFNKSANNRTPRGRKWDWGIVDIVRWLLWLLWFPRVKQKWVFTVTNWATSKSICELITRMDGWGVVDFWWMNGWIANGWMMKMDR